MSTDTLIAALQNPALYDHPTKHFTVLETHCSYVLLTGNYAYKIKKSVNFGFLDYSALEKRKRFCEEELRRNQAMAGQIYLQTVPIYGSDTQPSLVAKGEPIEYMVKMREFSQDNLLSKIQREQNLTADIIDKLAENLATFHLHAALVPHDSIIGSSDHAQQQTLDNFSQTLPLLTHTKDIEELTELRQAVIDLYLEIKPIIDQRKQQGSVRQCHGDVHLNNIVLIEDKPIIFDCIDFNDDFCWTDTMADLAFITMDLDEFGEHRFSWRLLNHYLDVTGDYDGLQVLNYFQSYRAMVRAKVAMFTLTHSQSEDERQQQYRRYKGCVKLAKQYLQKRQLRLLITCGVSASGKSTLAKHIAPDLSLIRLTSDRERKRQAAIDLNTDCTAPVLAGLYQPEQTQKTYQALLNLANIVLNAGYPVLIDATFREKVYRDLFAKLATTFKVPFIILYCHAPEKQLRQWLTKRKLAGEKISEATQDVLSMQLANFESPLLHEKAHTLEISTANSIPFATIVKKIEHINQVPVQG